MKKREDEIEKWFEPE